DATAAQRSEAVVAAAKFYAAWLPKLVTGPGNMPTSYADLGPSAGYLRYVERASRRLARSTFYGMARWQGGLEHKQGFLARIVDIGAELFAMTAVCAYAARRTTDPESAQALADAFCRQSRLRVEALFKALWTNTDARDERLATRVLAGDLTWAEAGVLDVSEGTGPWIAEEHHGPANEPNVHRRSRCGPAVAGVEAPATAAARGTAGSAHRQVPLPPGENVLEPGEPVLRCARPAQLVPLAREQQQLGRHPALLQPHVPALPLLYRAAPVLLGVDHQRGRAHLVQVRHRALCGHLLGVGAHVRLGEVPPDVRRTDEAGRVQEPALHDRRREPVGAGGQPRGHEPAVGAAEHTDAIGIQPRIGQRSIEEGEHVGGVPVPERAGDRPAVLLPVAGRPSWVAEHDGVACPGVGLYLVEKRGCVLAVRAAVDEQQHRVRPLPLRQCHPAVQD